MNDGVFRMHIHSQSIPNAALFELNELQNPYGLTVTSTNHLFVSDALDFQQNGWVYAFDTTGAQVQRFKVGEGPGMMLEFQP
jgi:hypothetical protein